MSAAHAQGIRVGVDVGGTNTDAVVMCATRVLGSAKHPTTVDVTTGIVGAVQAALADANASQALEATLSSTEVGALMLGTTHFINAVVQRRQLARVGVVRVCSDATHALPPLADFPSDLAEVVRGPVSLIRGGCDFDGNPLAEVDPAEVRRVAVSMLAAQVHELVVCSVFAPVRSDHETLVAALLRAYFDELGAPVSITLSHQVAHLGLLERENAAILNASLRPLARHTVPAFRDSLQSCGLSCPLFLTRNDGTLTPADLASEFPVFTFASGATNSMRGAMFLSGQENALVVDIGGTTSDAGALVNAYPRYASANVQTGGVRTNFCMPDLVSIGLGGGSIVQLSECEQEIRIGPLSVGYELTAEALVFGGAVCTVSDVLVRLGLLEIGDDRKVAHLPVDQCRSAYTKMQRMLEELIDQLKTEAGEIDVILVGGGAVVSGATLRGARQVIKPPHSSVANAVGAAVAQISGQVDEVCCIPSEQFPTRELAFQKLIAKATNMAVASGAIRDSCTVVEQLDQQLAYIPGGAIRIGVKVVGEMDLERFSKEQVAPTSTGCSAVTSLSAPAAEEELASKEAPERPTATSLHRAVETGEVSAIVPDLPLVDGAYQLTVDDVTYISIGAGILGTGGGGSPWVGRLRAHRLLQRGFHLQLIEIEQVPKDTYVLPCAFMGSPTVLIEKLPSGTEVLTAVRQMINLCEANGKKVSALMCCEIGGMNSIEPLLVGARLGLPVVSGDGMGRAFPELQMFCPFIYGKEASPCCIADEKGNYSMITDVSVAKELEDQLRQLLFEKLGCIAGLCFAPLPAADLATHIIPRTFWLAHRLGRVVREAQANKKDPVRGVAEATNGRVLFAGKITDVLRRTEGGFARASVRLEGLGEFTKREVVVEVQNENLVVRDQSGPVLACVPDLITLLDTETGEAFSTEELKYGMRCSVLCMPAPPLLRTERALKVVGPAAFGFSDAIYSPCGDYCSL